MRGILIGLRLLSRIFDPAPSVSSPRFDTSKSPRLDNAGPPVSGLMIKPPPLIATSVSKPVSERFPGFAEKTFAPS